MAGADKFHLKISVENLREWYTFPPPPVRGLSSYVLNFSPSFNHRFSCSHCSAKFSKFIDCVVDMAEICFGDWLMESEIRRIVQQNYWEDIPCTDGPDEIPTMPPYDSPCSDSFSSDANTCKQPFQQKFAADKSDPSLCW